MIYNREKTVPSVVAQLKRDIEEMKSSQIIGGDNIKIVITETANLFDVVDSVSAFSDAVWRVTFSTVQHPNLYTEFGLSLSATGDVDYTFYDDPSDMSDDDNKSYLVYVLPYTNSTVSMKFQFRSYITGSISWSRIL